MTRSFMCQSKLEGRKGKNVSSSAVECMEKLLEIDPSKELLKFYKEENEKATRHVLQLMQMSVQLPTKHVQRSTPVNPSVSVSALMTHRDSTLSNTRRSYSLMGNPSDTEGLIPRTTVTWPSHHSMLLDTWKAEAYTRCKEKLTPVLEITLQLLVFDFDFF